MMPKQHLIHASIAPVDAIGVEKRASVMMTERTFAVLVAHSKMVQLVETTATISLRFAVGHPRHRSFL